MHPYSQYLLNSHAATEKRIKDLTAELNGALSDESSRQSKYEKLKKELPEELAKLDDRISKFNATPDSEKSATSPSDQLGWSRLISFVVKKVGIVLFGFYLIRVLLGIYRHAARLVDFYRACGDALEFYELQPVSVHSPARSHKAVPSALESAGKSDKPSDSLEATAVKASEDQSPAKTLRELIDTFHAKHVEPDTAPDSPVEPAMRLAEKIIDAAKELKKQ